MPNAPSSTIDRALALLGQGQPPVVVASALGVTESRISQLLADPEFASKVQELRFQHLQKSTSIDSEYDDIEVELQRKLKKNLPLINKPRDILAAMSAVNGAKRRGTAAAADAANLSQKVVQLTLPQSVHQTFVTNIHNQITEIRDAEGSAQTLVTASSGSLDRFYAEQAPQRVLESPGTETVQEGQGEGPASERKITVEDL